MSESAVFKGQVATSPFLPTLGLVSTVEKENKGPRYRTRRELEDLKDAARAEGLVSGRAEGYERGQAEGRRDGEKAGYEQAFAEAQANHSAALDAFQAELATIRDDVQQAVEVWCNQAESRLTQLVVDMARTVVQRELEISHESIVSIVQEAMVQVTHARQAKVRVNPFDHALLESHKEELLTAASSVESFDIVDDPSIESGCVIETAGGIVDATLKTQFEALREAIDQEDQAA